MARCGRRPGVHRCRRPQLPACTCNPLTAALHSTRCCRVLRGRRAPSLASRPRSRAYLRRPFSPFSTMRRSSRAHCGCSELCARPGRRKAAWSCEAVAVASVVAHCLWLKNEMYFNRTTYARTDRGGSRPSAPPCPRGGGPGRRGAVALPAARLVSMLIETTVFGIT